MPAKKRSPKRSASCPKGKTRISYVRNGKRISYCRKSPKRSPKRKSPKRKSPKRKSPKRQTKQWTPASPRRLPRRRSPKRRSPTRQVKVRRRRQEPRTIYVLEEEPSPLILGLRTRYSPVRRRVIVSRPRVRSVVRPARRPAIASVPRPRRQRSTRGQGCTSYRTKRGCKRNNCYWTGASCLTP